MSVVAADSRILNLQSKIIERRMHDRAAVEAEIIARAVAEEDFRAELLADPRGVIERELCIQLGREVKLPADFTIKIVEETPDTAVLVLPARVPSIVPGTAPSDSALDPQGGVAYYCTTITCKPGFSC